ncbi:PEP-CTERM-box response regulator transcription factor [Halieaceae bacterium IMCC14734]|uniref:PEP-CTERM-box response regulator transcription factor n=1 Tax=Candidatus Litorirhabdus singularis TaxID=2518993 RepID=A0ABT3TG43_9GAMM|nr:PEP-CTERM-box response regulator transcription factor [Candidatus Litorirhabdus singularis]MCX2981280.1 PEP-CTERM-box response regulator transcription factor [Candidatus Litorirhabdus singularis]
MKKADRHLLVVEDDEGLQSQLKWAFEGYEVVIAGNREDGINLLRRHVPGVVLCDLGLPPDPGGVSEGLATLQEILALAPATKVIVVTGDDDRANAIKAIGLGAYDFYQKPVDADILSLIVDRAYQVYELELENKKLQEYQQHTPLNGIIATSPQMLKVCRTIEKVAPSDITTLLLGASGTGKELFARALHELSPRKNERMVAINCAAIPDTLLESELFGYEKGAFTGATQQTIGKIEHANGGTLFLDEIGDLPLELQAKLLRFLQERVIERVGGRKEIPVDVRIIGATHQNLSENIKDGSFREDLYYRISEITVDIPSLKEREGDALVIARSFLQRFSDDYKKNVNGFDKEAILALESHDWPGNVREMESRIKRAVIMSEGSQITLEDLEIEANITEPMPFNLKQIRDDAERKAVQRALRHCSDNISDAANVLGITRPTLYNMLEKYGIKI